LADHRVGIEIVEDVSCDGARCLVRCLEGPVRVGVVFTTLELSGGTRREVSLRVSRITRYGKPAEFFDPPHSALMELSGAEAGLLAVDSVLAAPAGSD
jgi:ribosomal protein S28E/S33